MFVCVHVFSIAENPKTEQYQVCKWVDLQKWNIYAQRTDQKKTTNSKGDLVPSSQRFCCGVLS